MSRRFRSRIALRSAAGNIRGCESVLIARSAAGLLIILVALCTLMLGAQPAHADTGDVITKYDIAYVVDEAGTVM